MTFVSYCCRFIFFVLVASSNKKRFLIRSMSIKQRNQHALQTIISEQTRFLPELITLTLDYLLHDIKYYQTEYTKHYFLPTPPRTSAEQYAGSYIIGSFTLQSCILLLIGFKTLIIPKPLKSALLLFSFAFSCFLGCGLICCIRSGYFRNDVIPMLNYRNKVNERNTFVHDLALAKRIYPEELGGFVLRPTVIFEHEDIVIATMICMAGFHYIIFLLFI